jgi:S-adenosylmethionine hydrolase
VARPPRPIIGLLTDFGQQDQYVGVMKAVIAGIVPDALVIDVSHAVPPQSVLAGQRLLRASVPYFPPDSVILAVVDPGVGGSRRPMALRSGERILVGPDNGLFSPWLPGELAVELANPVYRLPSVSSTFHGRDVFAPAVAHLALGLSLQELGPPLSNPVLLKPPEPVKLPDGTIVGEVVYVDHFGNLITNISARTGTAAVAGIELPLLTTYADAGPGQLLALAGSDDELEIAVRDGSAAQKLGSGAGTRVSWRP